jgi:hypothetical protein
MYAPTENLTPQLSVLARFPFWSQVFRHPRVWMGVLFASGSWNLFLGILMLSYGYWLGLLPLAASALMFWIGSRLYQIAQSQPAAPVAGRTGSTGPGKRP